jgi:hypothetical protein
VVSEAVDRVRLPAAMVPRRTPNAWSTKHPGVCLTRVYPISGKAEGRVSDIVPVVRIEVGQSGLLSLNFGLPHCEQCRSR